MSASKFDKVRDLVKTYSAFKFQNLCQRIITTNDRKTLREYAAKFGVPTQHWNNPRVICSLITPRISDFLEHIHCDNEDEATVYGDEVGSIPEFLKYPYNAPNGKTYCSSIIDLRKSLESGQTMDPYRRFELDADDINARYDFLTSIITPKVMGEDIMEKIRDNPIKSRREELISDLRNVWRQLDQHNDDFMLDGRENNYTVDEIMNMDEHNSAEIIAIVKDYVLEDYPEVEFWLDKTHLLQKFTSNYDGTIMPQILLFTFTQFLEEDSPDYIQSFLDYARERIQYVDRTKLLEAISNNDKSRVKSILLSDTTLIENGGYQYSDNSILSFALTSPDTLAVLLSLMWDNDVRIAAARKVQGLLQENARGYPEVKELLELAISGEDMRRFNFSYQPSDPETYYKNILPNPNELIPRFSSQYVESLLSYDDI